MDAVARISRSAGNRAFARMVRQALARAPAEFPVITELYPRGGTTEASWGTTDVRTRYIEIAKLAGVKLVTGKDPDAITFVTGVTPGVTADLQPGLNYASGLGVAGQTGFIDGKGVYREAQLPDDVKGVAIILGPEAFSHDKDKAFALATLRHEMLHARHYQRILEIRKTWQGSTGGMSFEKWVDRNQSLSGVERQMVKERLHRDSAVTESLAWIEGFVTIFHLGTPPPKLPGPGQRFPSAIRMLRGGGEFLRTLPPGPAVPAAVEKRLTQYCCDVINETQRKSLAAWAQFLLDLIKTAPDPKTATPELKLAYANWKPESRLLKMVRRIASQPCKAVSKRKPAAVRR